MPSPDNQVESLMDGDDCPKLRSVPIRAPGLQAKTSLPLPPASFKPPPLSRSALPLSKAGSSPADQGVLKEWTACTSSAWVVKAEDLEPLPDGFPLEKTHCEIHEEVSVVAARISDALRALSIESTYCSENVEATCQTEDCVRFKICMFAGGSDNGQPIIVEVQKRCGPAFLFSRTCRVLLNAAKGAPSSKLRHSPKTLPSVCNMKCLQGVVATETSHEDTATHLESVKRMLSSERSDERILALENLSCLTDSTKTSAVVSNQIANAVLKDETLRNYVLLTISRADSVHVRYENSSVSDQASHLSLTAFGNALEHLRTAEDSLATVIEADSWYTVKFVPQVLDEIAKESQLSTSYQGTRSLMSLLLVGDSEVAKTICSAGGTEILRKAHERGKRSHELLERETKRCLDYLSKNETCA